MDKRRRCAQGALERAGEGLGARAMGRTTLANAAGSDGNARAALDRLLVRAAGGDRAAFGLLYEQTAAKLFAVTLRISPTRAEAEDALQEAYLTIWRRAAAFDPARGSASTWIGVVTRNVAIDRLRARRLPLAPIEAADSVADPAPSAVERLATAGEHERLTACVATLRPVDATYIRAAFFEGATYSELAARAGQPLATVKSRIRRALIALRACLQ